MHECEVGQLIDHVGLRCSKDRHALISLFHQDRAWSARQLVTELKHTARATVFRNVQLLLESRLIAATIDRGGETFYEWAGRKHHDHLVCEKCDAPECIPCPVPKLKKHLLELSGLCSQCK